MQEGRCDDEQQPLASEEQHPSDESLVSVSGLLLVMVAISPGAVVTVILRFHS